MVNLQYCNLFDSQTNICLEDIEVDNEKATLHLKSSKTDPFRQGVDIYLFATGASVCPVRSLQKYIKIRNQRFNNKTPTDPFFVMEDSNPLTRAYFIHSMKRILERMGYNPVLYNGHSFRIGASTTAGSKIEDHMIQTLGRWSSQCYVRYIRTPLSTIKQAQKALLSE